MNNIVNISTTSPCVYNEFIKVTQLKITQYKMKVCSSKVIRF